MEGSGCDTPAGHRDFFKADASRSNSAVGPRGKKPLPPPPPPPPSYFGTFPLFLPPPQPPLHSTGLSRKEMRSLLENGADVVCFGDGRFSPE